MEIDEHQMESLIKCKESDKRMFNKWNVQQLLNEAIYEFTLKYVKEKEKH